MMIYENLFPGDFTGKQTFLFKVHFFTIIFDGLAL